MKKITLILALSALGTAMSYAGVCGSTGNQTLSSLLGNTCTFSDAGITWNLGNWTFNDTNSAGFNGAHPAASDITVSFFQMSTFSYSGLTLPSSIAGVFVKYTYTPTGTNPNFFTATTLNPGAAQKSSFKTGFGFEQLNFSPVPFFNGMFGIIDGYTVSNSTGNDGVQMTKNYQDTLCPSCATGFQNVVLGKSGSNGNAISTTTLISGHTFFNVSDDITLSAGGANTGVPATASINYFGNGQYVVLGNSGLASPEPGTVGMIGVGLLALGLIKRRMQ